MPTIRMTRRSAIGLGILLVLGVGVFIVWLPTLLELSARQERVIQTDYDAQPNVLTAVELYSPLDYEAVPLRIDETMMKRDADPCAHFVDYSCGRWLDASDQYRHDHPISFSSAQRNAVGLVSGIIALEKARVWDSSAVARFHEACTRTRSSAELWGQESYSYRELLLTIQNDAQLPWNLNTMTLLFARLASYGMTLPLRVDAVPDPTNTVGGGWVLQLQQWLVIGGGATYASDPLARVFTYRNPPRRMFRDYEAMLRLLWEDEPDMNTNAIDQKVRNVQTVQLGLTQRFNDEGKAHDSCWSTDSGGSENWVDYFQQPDCYARDYMTVADWATEAVTNQQHFDWQLLVDSAYGSDIYARLSGVWTPQGRKWVRASLDPDAFTSQEWRDYLEASVRYAVLRHYWPAEERARELRRHVGIYSPILSHYTSSGGVVRGGERVPRYQRYKNWEPSLRYNLGDTAAMTNEGVNQQRHVSEPLCTDLTFLYLQPLVERYFIEALGFDDPLARERVLQLMRDAVDELRKLVASSSSWTAGTRDFFQRKLQALIIALGLPPYDGLFNGTTNLTLSSPTYGINYEAISSGPEALVQNILVIRQQRVRFQWSSVLSDGPPRGKADLEMPTYEANAYYEPTQNSITLLAGILQPPFYSHVVEELPVLYARLVAIVGHELGHAFDPDGRMTDWSGSVLPAGYWQDAARSLDRLAFGATEECLIELYDGAVTSNGNREDGRKTLGENMADLVGLRVGYNAMLVALLNNNSVHNSDDDLHEAQQQFYLSWSQAWCTRMTGRQERDQIHHDVHALAELRITIPLSNMPEFAEAFNCPVGSAMNPSASSRCVFFH